MRQFGRDVAELGPSAHRLLGASALSNVGTGLVLPILVAFVTSINHLDIRVATTAVALTSVGAAVGGPVSGWAADRFGRRRTITLTLSLAALGTLTYSASVGVAGIVVAALLLGVGVGGNAVWFTLLAESVPDRLRGRAFGLNLLATNASIGIGGLVSGLAVHGGGEAAFRGLYVANALTFVAAILLIHRALAAPRREAGAGEPGPVPGPLPAAAETPDGAPHRATGDAARGASGSGYAGLLRHRLLLVLLSVVALAFAAGYSQLESGIPAATVGTGLISTSQLAVLFGVNTVAVVLVQMFLLRWIERGRTNVMAAGFAACWALTWVTVLLAMRGTVGHPLVWLVLGIVVFAVGETLFGTTVPALLNSLVSDRERGRANGLYSVAQSLGFFVGPLVAGQLLVTSGARTLAAILIAVCAALAVLCLAVLPRRSLGSAPGASPQDAPDASPEDVPTGTSTGAPVEASAAPRTP